jgi:hypothetical protein
MKSKFLLFTLFLLTVLPFSGQSQRHSIESVMTTSIQNLASFDTSTCKDCIFLQVEYGTTNFLNLDVLKRFQGEAIQQVDMVYTAFSRSKSFDQAALNQQRLQQLQAVAPELFEDKIPQWNMICQTSPTSAEESGRLFHGFVVHLRPGVAKRAKDGTLTPKAKPKEPKYTAPKVKAPPLYRDTTVLRTKISYTKKVKNDCKPTGKYLPIKSAKRKAGIRYDSEKAMIFWRRKPEKKCTEMVTYKSDTTFQKIVVEISIKTGKLVDESFYVDRSRDVTVTEVMTRNWADWEKEKVVMVQDVTGSMSSYLSQLLVWTEEYSKKGVDQFVFFNDGNSTDDNKKVIGRIGGIYYIKSNNINEIQRTADRAMNAGSGGDTPENNVEALKYAQEKCPKCTAMVLVGDNGAPVKDMILLPKIKLPVHVLVCAADNDSILADYVNIAAKTKGSLHTSNFDLDFSGKLEESVKIGEKEYVLEKGSYKIKG